jgi:hypothetical protein
VREAFFGTDDRPFCENGRHVRGSALMEHTECALLDFTLGESQLAWRLGQHTGGPGIYLSLPSLEISHEKP